MVSESLPLGKFVRSSRDVGPPLNGQYDDSAQSSQLPYPPSKLMFPLESMVDVVKSCKFVPSVKSFFRLRLSYTYCRCCFRISLIRDKMLLSGTFNTQAKKMKRKSWNRSTPRRARDPTGQGFPARGQAPMSIIVF